MDVSSKSTNGAGSAESHVPASALPISDLPNEREIYLAAELDALRMRVVSLETDRDRMIDAMYNACEMLLNHPMASATVPKQMRQQLKKFVDERAKSPIAASKTGTV